MCLGSSPQAPQVVYSGPSDADIKANQQGLDTYKQQMEAQQASFQEQLQAQIDTANADYAKLEKDYEAELASAKAAAQKDLSAAVAAGAQAQTSAYKVSTQQSDPVNAQTTKAITDKKKPNNSLKITSGSTAASAGTGLNIGV